MSVKSDEFPALRALFWQEFCSPSVQSGVQEHPRVPTFSLLDGFQIELWGYWKVWIPQAIYQTVLEYMSPFVKWCGPMRNPNDSIIENLVDSRDFTIEIEWIHTYEKHEIILWKFKLISSGKKYIVVNSAVQDWQDIWFSFPNYGVILVYLKNLLTSLKISRTFL